MNVLVVDDCDSIRITVRRILEFEKIYCETAENVDEGLNLLEHAKNRGVFFDAVLLDLLMPGASPDVLVDLLKTDLAYGAPRILAFSASPNALKESFHMTVDGCIPKPFSIDELLATLK